MLGLFQKHYFDQLIRSQQWLSFAEVAATDPIKWSFSLKKKEGGAEVNKTWKMKLFRKWVGRKKKFGLKSVEDKRRLGTD